MRSKELKSMQGKPPAPKAPKFLSHEQTRGLIQDALADKPKKSKSGNRPSGCYVRDVLYDTSGSVKVIYDDGGKTFEQPASISEDSVDFKGEPTEVFEKKTYEPVDDEEDAGDNSDDEYAEGE